MTPLPLHVPAPGSAEQPIADALAKAGFIVEVNAYGWGYYNLTDAALAQAGQLQSIAFLDLFESCDSGEVTDVGLVHLARNRSLASLRLGPGITDVGVAHLAGLTQLKDLRLDSAANITDGAMTTITKLVALQTLSLQYTQAGDAGLAKLSMLPHLKELVLSATLVTDAGLSTLSRMRTLTMLALSDTAITDAGVAKLADLTGLTTLWLDGTHITDAAIHTIGHLPKLTQVLLDRTAVTEAGVRALKAALSNCEVF
jgi:hypothetical protein